MRRLGSGHVGEPTQGHEIIDWWLSGDGRWHEGAPPPGWTQAEDRRWYLTEPPFTAVGYASKSESIAGPPATVVYEEDWYDAEDPGQDDWDGTGWYPDGEAEDDIEDRGRRWRRRAGLAVMVAVLAAVTGTLGILALSDGGSDSGSAPSATTTTTSFSPAPVPDASGAGPPATEAARPSTTDRADAPPVSTRSTPSTTVGSPPEPAPPPATNPPRTPPGSIRQGGPCETVGATAVTANGTPVTCATAGCDGDPFDEPRWRRTAC